MNCSLDDIDRVIISKHNLKNWISLGKKYDSHFEDFYNKFLEIRPDLASEIDK